MSYASYDFSESMNRSPVPREQIESVVAAWGKGDGMGEDAGHYKWAADGASDWTGGFLMKLRDGRYCYLTGWCDYTGWGCQDGINVFFFDHEPSVNAMRALSDYHNEPEAAEWDREPADLNRWLATGVEA